MQASGSDRPTLIFLVSGRCGRCRRAEGFLAQVLQRRRNHDTFSIRRIDLDERPEIANRLGVSESPALVIVEERRVQSRLVRPRGAREIQQFLAPWLR